MKLNYTSFYGHAENDQYIIQWLNTVLKKQIETDRDITYQEVEHIIDFFKSDQSPNRITRMSYDTALEKSKLWTESLSKKGNNILEKTSDIEILKTYETGYSWVKLVGENAFKREGALMRHCVASYFNKPEVQVLSLRDSKNNPHCTVEITQNDSTVQQIKGKGNGLINPNYIDYVLDLLKDYKQLNDHDLVNLGYYQIPSDLTSIIVESVDKKFIKELNNKLFYFKV